MPDHWDVRVAAEAEPLSLGCEVIARIRFPHDVTPITKVIQRGVNELATVTRQGERQVAQVGALLDRKFLTCELNSALRYLPHFAQVTISRGCLVVVALDDRATETANSFNALGRIRRVADDGSKTNSPGNRLRIHVRQDGLRRLQVRVDICEHR